MFNFVTSVKDVFQQGGIIAYPTEAVFGLGCDPDNQQAIERLLSVKNRPKTKGLILLAANYAQLQPYIDDSAFTVEQRKLILSRWPNGITQLIKKQSNTSSLISGEFNTIAVRITSQPDVVALCNSVNKPIISTSANLSGQPPAKTWQEVETNLANKVDFIIKGQTLGYSSPSSIINAISGETIRP
ncbi:L-threonylcarbamoyladenylate synthase [Thalassotalea profundi]|uniref:Threonylcarbamoyl-AMP synthase n=1 Tax=Thalassotalea profundi TaxID=2036687 RepID=A0ABQ3IXW7_9GAMM|nr:L-threonylcarbamoyladenylate synthase [Thalassotalea profundi]GHE96460.1 threonylcarbamoyl-AMP synthase [Thalassotalea profundi]